MAFDQNYFDELSAIVAHARATNTIVRKPTYGKRSTAKANAPKAADDPLTQTLRDIDASFKPGALRASMIAMLKREGKLK